MKKDPEALVIGIGKAKPEEGDAEMSEAYGEEAKEAAQSFIDAVKAGDADGLVEAFAAMKRVC